MNRTIARQTVLHAIEHLSWDADDRNTLDAIRILTRVLERL